MEILPEEIVEMVDDYVVNWRHTFNMVLRELSSCVKIASYTCITSIEINIKWVGYNPKKNIDLEPFLPNESLFDTKLVMKNPRFKIYVPYRQLHANDPAVCRKKIPEILTRKCENFENIERASFYYYLKDQS